MLNSLDTLPEDPTELREGSQLFVSEVKALSLKVEQLQHQLHGHNRHRFGSKSEGLDQLNLTFAEDEEISKAAAAQTEPATEPDEDQSPAASTAASHCPIISNGTTRCCRWAMIAVAAAVTSKRRAKM